MSQFWLGNAFLGLSMLTGAGGQVALKRLMTNIGGLRIQTISPAHLWQNGAFPLAFLTATLLIAGFLFWIASLSRLDIAYAYPLACASALLVALFSAVFLGETITTRMVIGTVFIVAGTALLVPSR
jgi:drug/metabolite transporter (DMT)-like permease